VQQRGQKNVSFQGGHGYRRKANWNTLDAWGVVSKYLDNPGLAKAASLSKSIRIHTVNSPSFRAALSKHRLGR